MKQITFNNSYVNLGEDFYVKTLPTKVANPTLFKFNDELAEELGLPDGLDSPHGAGIFSGNVIPDRADPLAMAYAGHQFGGFSPQLGDGRAILLGEIISPNETRFDFQLKGSGRTFYSRGGDGRSALGPVIREYLVSEAMAKLGVPTTRALAAISTGEEVARESLVPGGVLTRIATGFVRVGTFQYLAANGNIEGIKKLADYVIDRNYPALNPEVATDQEDASEDNKYDPLLKAIINRQAKLIADWMRLGFIHGVMNTDNMSVVGETIDYGPCAFMDDYSHAKVFSSIDRGNRYAYNNQPQIALWNLTRLAETFIPLLAEDTDEAVEIAKRSLEQFSNLYESYWLENMREKLALSSEHASPEEDRKLIEELLNIMDDNHADFTLTFYYLTQSIVDENSNNALVALFGRSESFESWLVKWHDRISKEAGTNNEKQARMRAVNPIYIPRNHQIEAAIRAAEDNDDFSVFYDLHEVLKTPFTQQSGKDSYMLSPEANQVVSQTFCGT